MDLFQPLFDLGSDEPASVEAVRAVEDEQKLGRAIPEIQASAASKVKQGLIEQIKRDARVLREDPIYHVPSTEFYELRIAAFRRELTRETA